MCRINVNFIISKHPILLAVVPYQVIKRLLQIEVANNKTSEITSEPYQLCFCENNKVSDCLGVKKIKAYRGQKFTLSLIAYAQGNTPVSIQVTVKIEKTARLKLNQSTQALCQFCTDTTYNIYSTEMDEELTLYVDGPCRDTGLATAVVNVTLRQGFNISNDECECEIRLQEEPYDAECMTDTEEKIYVKRRTTSSRLFWMSTLYMNESYHGLILYASCPPE